MNGCGHCSELKTDEAQMDLYIHKHVDLHLNTLFIATEKVDPLLQLALLSLALKMAHSPVAHRAVSK